MLSSLGCAVQLAETQSPSTAPPVAFEAVETIPIQNSRENEISSSTGRSCVQLGPVMRCTVVSRDELQDRFDELQPLDRY